jgi:hypothetical protein
MWSSVPRPALIVSILAALLVTACTSTEASPSAASSTAASTPATSSVPASQPESSAAPSGAVATPVESADAVPSADLAAFTCDLPIVESGSVPIANITDVRVGTHDGFDRFVIEFEQGTPELTLDRAEPPFTQDGSGLPVEVRGESFLALVLRGGTRQTDEGTSSFDGPTEWDADLPALVHAVQAGDFERQSTWYLGLEAQSCVRLLLLDGPPRLVIDLEHP